MQTWTARPFAHFSLYYERNFVTTFGEPLLRVIVGSDERVRIKSVKTKLTPSKFCGSHGVENTIEYCYRLVSMWEILCWYNQSIVHRDMHISFPSNVELLAIRLICDFIGYRFPGKINGCAHIVR